MASLSQHPWRSSPILLLDPQPSLERFIVMASQIADMPGLRKLPREIMIVIMEACESCPVICSCAVEETIEALSGDADKLSRPLQHLESWHRGSQPVLTEEPRGDIIRVSIDDKGIKSLRRDQHDENTPTKSRIVEYSVTMRPGHEDSFVFQVDGVSFPCILGHNG